MSNNAYFAGKAHGKAEAYDDVLAMLHEIGGHCKPNSDSYAEGWDEAVNEIERKILNAHTPK